MNDNKPSYETLEKALHLACRRVVDSPQSYEEADTAEGWYAKFVEQAETDGAQTEAARM